MRNRLHGSCDGGDLVAHGNQGNVNAHAGEHLL